MTSFSAPSFRCSFLVLGLCALPVIAADAKSLCSPEVSTPLKSANFPISGRAENRSGAVPGRGHNNNNPRDSNGAQPCGSSATTTVPDLKNAPTGFDVDKSVFSLVRTDDESRFPDVPKGKKMRTKELLRERSDHLPIFGWFSTLISYLYPRQYPVELIRELFRNKPSSQEILFQAAKLEALAALWISLWILLSLCLPCGLAARACSRPKSDMQRLRENASASSSYDPDEEKGCFFKATTVFLHILLLSILFVVLAILASNEVLSRSVEKAPEYVETVFEDLESFVENSEMQISFVVRSAYETSLNNVQLLLDNSETHLGVPIMDSFAESTGLNVTIELYRELQRTSTDVSYKIEDLRRVCKLAKKARKALDEKLLEFWANVVDFGRKCTKRDRVFCDPLLSMPIATTFSVAAVYEDMNLRKLQEILKRNDLQKNVDRIVGSLHDIPNLIARHTREERADVGEALGRHRGSLLKSLRALEGLSKHVTASIRSTSEHVRGYLPEAAHGEYWRYLLVLGLSFALFLTWSFCMCGAPCGCGPNHRMPSALLVGLVLSALLSTLLCLVASASLLAGGHGHILICSTLSEPRHRTLALLLNRGGIFYERNGFLADLLRRNDSLPIYDVLQKCQRGDAVYSTFKLQSSFDLNLLDYAEWADFSEATRKLNVGSVIYKSLPDDVYNETAHLSGIVSAINLTEHRRTLGGKPLTDPDLHTFGKHLEAALNNRQITDPNTLNSLRSLRDNLNSVLAHELQDLAKNAEDVLYELTSLEILMKVFRNRTVELHKNLVGAKLKLVQNESSIVSQHKSSYVQKMVSELAKFRAYVAETLVKQKPDCSDLWDVFDGARVLTCQMIVGPLNALAMFLYLAELLLLVLAPVTVYLRNNYYKQINEDGFTSTTHRKDSEDEVINDEDHWASLPSGSPETIARNLDTLERPTTPPNIRIPPPPSPSRDVSSSTDRALRRQETQLEVVAEESSWTTPSGSSPIRRRNWI